MDSTLSPAQAKLKLTLLDKKVEAKNSYEVYSEFLDIGLPPVVMEILDKISKVTWKIAQETFAVGKIILVELLKFVKKHPFVVAGLTVGCLIGAAIGGLLTVSPMIANMPLLGSLLVKLLSVLSTLGKTVFIAGGLILGIKLDNKFPDVGQELHEIAKDFFKMLAEILESLQARYSNGFSLA